MIICSCNLLHKNWISVIKDNHFLKIKSVFSQAATGGHIKVNKIFSQIKENIKNPYHPNFCHTDLESKYQTTAISCCILKPGHYQSICHGSSSFSGQFGHKDTDSDVCRKDLLDMAYFNIILPGFPSHFKNDMTFIHDHLLLRDRNLYKLFLFIFLLLLLLFF